jgi:hypothetical protein
VVVTPDGDIVSASLDKTIRVWRGGQCVQVLEGHEAAVLCLLQLPNGDLLSGSGDCTIKVWSGGKCTHTIAAHSDSVRWVPGGAAVPADYGQAGRAVAGQDLPRTRLTSCCPFARLPLPLPIAASTNRGLALLPNVGVVSASHDQLLKVWTFSGECIAELAGHTALVYCAAATADGLVASGSEDNTAKLWHADGTCLQVRGCGGCGVLEWNCYNSWQGYGGGLCGVLEWNCYNCWQGYGGGLCGKCNTSPEFQPCSSALTDYPRGPGCPYRPLLPCPAADPGAPQQPVGGGLPAQWRPGHRLLRSRGSGVDPGSGAAGPRRGGTGGRGGECCGCAV